MLDSKGRPTITERAWMIAPGSRIGPASQAERQAIRSASLLGGKYEQTIDRESAYEVLLKRTESGSTAANSTAGAAQNVPKGTSPTSAAANGMLGIVNDFLFGSTGPRGGRRDGVVQSVAKSVARR